MTFELRLSTALRLSVKAAIIEHLRWDVCGIPSTVREIAGSIGRSESAVSRALSRMVDEGGAIRCVGRRYTLTSSLMRTEEEDAAIDERRTDELRQAPQEDLVAERLPSRASTSAQTRRNGAQHA